MQKSEAQTKHILYVSISVECIHCVASMSHKYIKMCGSGTMDVTRRDMIDRVSAEKCADLVTSCRWMDGKTRGVS